jgi:NAD(P)-dependent dehydrogenase (short-subunit alcohol dehydrogenase family)
MKKSIIITLEGESMKDKKVAFITGANRGIGFETARELAENDVTVIMGARDKTKGEAAAEKLKEKGLDAIFFPLDVNQLSDHKKLYEFLDKDYGCLDILVNNAGVLLDHQNGGTGFSSQSSQEVLRKTFDANFFNLVAFTQTLLPLIRRAPAGRIVNVSSILGSLTEHSDPTSSIYGSNTFAYDASKSALNAFTVHLANELKGTKIKVNSAHPGWVQTDMGGPLAPIEVKDGARTSIRLALLPEEGPTGGFYHLEEVIPW